MAKAVAEGAGSVPGAPVTVKRVPETIPPEQAKAAHIKLDQDAPVATIDEFESGRDARRFECALFTIASPQP